MHLLRAFILAMPLVGFGAAKCQKAEFYYSRTSSLISGGIYEPPYTDEASMCELDAALDKKLKKEENSLAYIDFPCIGLAEGTARQERRIRRTLQQKRRGPNGELKRYYLNLSEDSFSERSRQLNILRASSASSTYRTTLANTQIKPQHSPLNFL